MLAKAVDDLLGDEVFATDGSFGVLQDFYFDRDCWRLCYLLIARGPLRALVSMACVESASPARGHIGLSLTREQLRAGGWRIGASVPWLDEIRVCSGRYFLGWRVYGEDGPSGEVADLLIDRATWSIDYLVANITDAFGRRQVVLPLDWAEPLDPAEVAVRMRRTRAQLSSAPAINAVNLLRVRGSG
jgi:hypothetical protein